MADAASPAARPAGRCQLLHPPRWRASRRGSTLAAKRDCRSSGQIVTAGPSSPCPRAHVPPRSAGRGCPHVRLLVYGPGVALLLVTEFPSDK